MGKRDYELRLYLGGPKKAALQSSVVLATFVSMIGLGVLLGSQAMQWAGAVMWFLFMFGWATSLREAMRCSSFDEARRKLDEWEREVGK